MRPSGVSIPSSSARWECSVSSFDLRKKLPCVLMAPPAPRLFSFTWLDFILWFLSDESTRCFSIRACSLFQSPKLSNETLRSGCTPKWAWQRAIISTELAPPITASTRSPKMDSVRPYSPAPFIVTERRNSRSSATSSSASTAFRCVVASCARSSSHTSSYCTASPPTPCTVTCSASWACDNSPATALLRSASATSSRFSSWARSSALRHSSSSAANRVVAADDSVSCLSPPPAARCTTSFRPFSHFSAES